MPASMTFVAHSSYVLCLEFSADGQTLISSGMDNVVKLWSVPDWRLIEAYEGHGNSVNSISLSPDGQTLATGSSDKTVRLWSFPGGEPLRTLQDRKQVVSSVRMSGDGKWVLAGSYGGRVIVWTLDGDKVVGIKASQRNLASIALSPDSTTLVTAGLGGDIGLWSLPSAEALGTLTGHETAVMSVRFVHQGQQLLSLGYDQTVRFWNSADWQEERVLRTNLPGLRGISLSADESTVSLSLPSLVQVRSVRDWVVQKELPVSTKVVNGMAFSPDGAWLAAGAADGKITVWRLDKGEPW